MEWNGGLSPKAMREDSANQEKQAHEDRHMVHRKFLGGTILTISALLLCFSLLLPLRAWPQTSRFDLYIGYRLPTNSDLAPSARKAEGDFIQQHALTLHGCGDDSDCQKDAEIGFRRQIAGVARFWLAKCPANNCDHVDPVMELTADQAVDDELDQNFDHIERPRYSPIGLYLELESSTCTLRKVSDNSEVGPSLDWVCKNIIQQEQFTENVNRTNRMLKEQAERYRREIENEFRETTLLAEAAKRNDTSEMLKHMMRGGEVDTRDPQGRTPLMFAASGCALDAVRFLLSYRAGWSLDWKDKSGKSALDYVSCKTNAETEKIHYLLRLNQLLAQAAARNNTALMKRYVSEGASVDGDEQYRTPLMWAARACAFDAVKFLLDLKARVLLKDASGKTALEYVSCKSETTARRIKALLESGYHNP